MAENVIESLEVVEIDEKNGQRLLFAGSDLQSSFKRFFEKASIEQLPWRITNRPFAKGLADVELGGSQAQKRYIKLNDT